MLRLICIVCVLALIAAPSGAAASTLVPEFAPSEREQERPDQERVDRLLASVSPGQRSALEDLIAEMDKMDRQVEAAAEEYNGARARLTNLKQDIAQAQADYEAVSQAYKVQSERVGARLEAVYREGTNPELSLLLNAGSLSELVTVAQYIFVVSERDAESLQLLKEQRTRLEDTLNQLDRDRTEAEALEFEMKARQIEVGYRVADQRAALQRRSPALLSLWNRFQNAAGEDEAALYTAIATGSIDDIEIESGSPVETALAYRGIPYVWGGESKSGMDCSGLVLFVFKQHGVTLPHYSQSQAKLGTEVTGELLPGDAVFFGSPIHHVGIYIGGGYYIHAPRTGDVVKISKLSSRSDLVGARRYNWQPRTGDIL